MVKSGDNCVEFVLISLLTCVEFYNSALHDVDEVEQQTVVGLLLLASCET